MPLVHFTHLLIVSAAGVLAPRQLAAVRGDPPRRHFARRQEAASGRAVRACRAEPVPSRSHRYGPHEPQHRGVSADPLSQGNDDPLWPAHVGHAPDVLVLTDAADQAEAVGGQSVNCRLQVVHFE